MGCGCNKRVKKIANTIGNLAMAAIKQPDIVEWFKDGITGIVKCMGGSSYSDEQLVQNRNACRECPHSTKTDGKLTMQSQCMAPDPAKSGAPCGCIIMCKTQVGTCPLGKWTQITINNNGMGS